MGARMNYRREIDGLRAFAVLPVILFHAGFDFFSGGFVGVDVFFVISGYLITLIIINELAAKEFSLVNFYERRARRILPALFLVILVCIPFAWVWLQPGDMQDFAQSTAAVALFVSNILFWSESGYFDAAAEMKPFLHTWSLAVEEQYYLFIPILLLLLWRLGAGVVFLILLAIGFSSLVLAEWALANAPATAFYMLPMRGWELLFGAYVAFFQNYYNLKRISSTTKELGGLVGIGMVLYATFFFDKNTPFPGLYALVPVTGTALIILFASSTTVVGKFLSYRVFVGVGLISYSAYLWHQPLFAFARHRSIGEPNQLLFFLLAICSLLFAFLSWKWVERPFRDKQRVGRRAIFTFALVGSCLLIGFGVTGHYMQGFPSRSVVVSVDDLDAKLIPNHGLSTDCEGQFTLSPNCRTSDEPEVLVWGDSYAMHIVPGLIASKPDIQMIQHTMSVCGPFMDIAPVSRAYPKAWAEKCIDFNDQVFEHLETLSSVKYVVLSSPFIQYLNYHGFKMVGRNGDEVAAKDTAYVYMKNTLERIKALGKVPVVFSITPQNGSNIGRCLRNSFAFKSTMAECNVSEVDAHEYRGKVYEFLKEIDKSYNVIWLDEALCENGQCISFAGDVFIYRDDGHLSIEGSEWLGKFMGFYERIKNME